MNHIVLFMMSLSTKKIMRLVSSNSVERYLKTLCVLLLLSISCGSSAGWEENLGHIIEKLPPKIKERIENKLDPTKSSQTAPSNTPTNTPTTNSPPLNLPSHWRVLIDSEPVFKSQLYIVETGRENRQTVVLIHGLGQAGFTDWLKVIPELEKKYHVLAMDLPGFGRSSVPSGRYSPTNYAKVISWLVRKYANGPVVVVGHSMGGAVALRYASDFPEQVSKVVLVDVAGILERTAFAKHSAELPLNEQVGPNPIRGLTSKVKNFVGALVELTSVVPDISKIINASDIIWNNVFFKRPNLNAAMALIQEDFSRAIKTLPHEVSIIWGGQDNIAPLRIGHMLAGRLPQASLTVIPSSQHMPMVTHAQEFNRLLLGAITGTLKKPPARERLVSKGDLVCKGRNGITYSGVYDNVFIENCSGVRLVNVRAQKATLKNSDVSFLNTRIESVETALFMSQSTLIATNSIIHGKVGILASGCRLDLAGVSIIGEQRAISINARSRFIFSVSDVSGKLFTGNVHGVYRAENVDLGLVMASGRR